MNLAHALRRLAAEELHEVRAYDDSVVRRDAKEREKANPDRNAEIELADLEELTEIRAEQIRVEEPRLGITPEHEEPAAPRHEHAGEHHERRGDAPELQVEEQEDDAERERHHDREPLGRADLILVRAGELVGHAGGNVQVDRQPGAKPRTPDYASQTGP